jgi:archaellum component FlaC
MKNIITSLNNRIVTTAKTVTECRSKINELENSIEGMSNLFDNVKVECAKNKTEIKKTSEVLGSENK